jgi:hypothetical protein
MTECESVRTQMRVWVVEMKVIVSHTLGPHLSYLNISPLLRD